MSASSNRPNLLIIVVDCLRADRCPVSGDAGPLAAWPALRDRGAVFSQMISTASTTPVCFASLLTGQYPFVHGIRTIDGPRLNDGVPTLATILGQQGYRTFAYLAGPLVGVFGFEEGFSAFAHHGSGGENFYNDWGRQFIDGFAQTHFAADQPAFVLLHLFEVHHPRALNGRSAPRRSMLEYDLAWHELDAKLADLLANVPDNTLVVLTADHGEQIGRRSDRTLWGHAWRKLRHNFRRPARVADWKGHGFHLYEELIRIPFVVAGPGVPSGFVTNDPARQIDIAPTLLDLLGMPMPPMQGRSLRPLLSGKSLPIEPAYIESGRGEPVVRWRGLRERPWKYAEHPADDAGRQHDQPSGDAELFNFVDDPGEMRNLIRSHPDEAARLREKMRQILATNPLANIKARQMTEEQQSKLTKQLKALGYM